MLYACSQNTQKECRIRRKNFSVSTMPWVFKGNVARKNRIEVKYWSMMNSSHIYFLAAKIYLKFVAKPCYEEGSLLKRASVTKFLASVFFMDPLYSIEIALKGYSGAWEKLIHEKIQKSTISWHFLFTKIKMFCFSSHETLWRHF